MTHAIEFIETPTFTRQIKEIATDDELRELQHLLIADPERGALIQGSGGLRKVRMPLGNRGKSGGARIIYFLATPEVIYLILAYSKNEKESLTGEEKSKLRTLTALLKGEVK
ncbi:MAG: addiction module toxin RelE [Marinobacter sp. 34-60-7]|nr:MAG: addiction module toxin RelE [Marinobacter sp. 34-60-7]